MLMLASEKDKCKLVNSQKQWTLFYGTNATNQVKIGEYSSEVPYKIVVRHTTGDRMVSYLGGFFLTLGRRTIEMHKCESDIQVVSNYNASAEFKFG